MPYSDSLAERVRALVANHKGIVEKRMFGGIGFLSRGNMCLAIWHDSLIVRVGAQRYEESLQCPFVKEFDVTGRALTGWVMVLPDGLDAEHDLRAWVERGMAFTATLPVKPSAKDSPQRRGPNKRRGSKP